ncbi:hypothetical protein F442_13591 [Phytophthora nicotianae P10297]|uniref:Uncharacterized protein n=1 Tax=Phytophthora nicotianae P10297 TaxID=1317064 RepID=W2YY59_PHYNI|nr:hypothetical protein F442_13591 [Phytophthora nicotianae P10297]
MLRRKMKPFRADVEVMTRVSYMYRYASDRRTSSCRSAAGIVNVNSFRADDWYRNGDLRREGVQWQLQRG